jgi:hypothetical protein
MFFVSPYVINYYYKNYIVLIYMYFFIEAILPRRCIKQDAEWSAIISSPGGAVTGLDSIFGPGLRPSDTVRVMRVLISTTFDRLQGSAKIIANSGNF